jgi:hypothetical protein
MSLRLLHEAFVYYKGLKMNYKPIKTIELNVTMEELSVMYEVLLDTDLFRRKIKKYETLISDGFKANTDLKINEKLEEKRKEMVDSVRACMIDYGYWNDDFKNLRAALF